MRFLAVNRALERLSLSHGASAIRFHPPSRLLSRSVVALFIRLQHLQMRFDTLKTDTHVMHSCYAIAQ